MHSSRAGSALRNVGLGYGHRYHRQTPRSAHAPTQRGGTHRELPAPSRLAVALGGKNGAVTPRLAARSRPPPLPVMRAVAQAATISATRAELREPGGMVSWLGGCAGVVQLVWDWWM